MFSLFGQISRLQYDHPLRRLALRQVILRGSLSWFGKMRELAMLYKIDLLQALNTPWKKPAWKRHCKESIYTRSRISLLEGINSKKSVGHMLLDFKDTLKPNGVWNACIGRPHMVPAAISRSRMMTGRFSCNSAPWLREKTDGMCVLCGSEQETTPHLLTECSITQGRIKEAIANLRDIYRSENLEPPKDKHQLLSAMINGDRYSNIEDIVQLKKNNKQANIISNFICHSVYKLREERLNTLI